MSFSFNPLNHPVCLQYPERLVDPKPWASHIPFAMYLTSVLKPKLFVELGTHSGNSYTAFCQAVNALRLETKCFAVDTWEGDQHAGFYGNQVYEDLVKHHDPLYGSFSRLLRMSFDDAKGYFNDGSIDLLHIDGLHTYEAVRHDFENWKPKLKQNALVIFHDTNVRENDFGVWRYWEELSKAYTHLEFLHGNGLGIISLGDLNDLELAQLFDSENLENIRLFFSSLGEKYAIALDKDQLTLERDYQISVKNDLVQERENFLTLKQQLDNAIVDFQNHNAELSLGLSNAQNALTAQEIHTKDLLTHIDNLQAEMETLKQSYQKEVERLSQDSNRLQNQITETQAASNAEKRKHGEELQNLQALLDKVKQENAEIMCSSSWRLTRLFRKMKKFFSG